MQIANYTRFTSNGRLSISVFSKSNAILNVKDEHTFGCSIFILDNSLQNGYKILKWDPCIHIRVYIGKSLFHAGSISLIMNATTRLISLQFHYIYDDNFTTINTIRADI